MITKNRVGHLRLNVQFSEALPQDVTMLMYCEFPSTLYIHKNKSIGTSYTPR